MTTGYDVGDYQFDPAEFLPDRLFHAVTDVRVNEPDAIYHEAQCRRRRHKLTVDGKLVILATDHPGRRVTGIRNEPMAMADRRSYLARAIRVLTTPGCDGIMGNTDFTEELLAVNYLVRQAGGPSLLDGKVLVGCMNRGGHAGTVGEIDDRFTCFSAQRLAAMRFEGGKMMYRLDQKDERSIKAISDCADAITALVRHNLYAFVEPMTVEGNSEGVHETVKTIDAMAKDAGACAALGESSTRTWLKLSYADGYERVSQATTLPILMLGGPAREDPTPILENFAKGMRAGPNVRGVMVGRNVSFVQKDDPGAVAAAVCGIIHDGCTVDDALQRLADRRGKDMDLFSTWR